MTNIEKISSLTGINFHYSIMAKVLIVSIKIPRKLKRNLQQHAFPDQMYQAQPLRVRRERTPPAIPPPRIQRFVPNSYQEQGQVRQEWPLPANSLHDNGEPRRAQAPNVFIPTENQVYFKKIKTLVFYLG